MSKLYTLFAAPRFYPADFVMVAPLRLIEEYLGAQVPRTFAAGESAFTIDHDAHGPDRHPLVGHWMVVEGIRLPKPKPVAPDENIGSMVVPATLAAEGKIEHDGYLGRFPVEHRASAERAYQDGFVDGQNARDEEAATASESWEDSTARGK